MDELFPLPPDAGDAESERRAAVRDVLAITGTLPWQPLPGSLADITGR